MHSDSNSDSNSDFEPAYLLHSRPYRNTSAIADFLTLNHGRVAGVVKGVFGKGRGAQQQRGILQVLQPLLINWRGRSALKNVNKIEMAGAPYALQGDALYSALYLNELLMRTLQSNAASRFLFAYYQQALEALSRTENIECPLREFELHLLQELGYGLNFDVDADGDAIEECSNYQLDTQRGFISATFYFDDLHSNSEPAPVVFSGSSLLSIGSNIWSDEIVRRDAKRLLRQALRPHIGTKPLRSRSLFLKR